MLTRILDHITHARGVWSAQDQIIAAQTDYNTCKLANDLYGMAVAAERLADQLGRQVDHLEASRLARAVSARPPVETLRVVAAYWRRRAEEMWADLAANQS